MVTALDRVWEEDNLEPLTQLIRCSNSIAISGHTNPDGDSIGALLSLGLGLESMGKQVFMICEGQVPKNYTGLPGASRVVHSLEDPVDLAIAVDCGSKEMIGPVFESFRKAATILEIDHHTSRTPFGDFSYIDPSASSAGELVYKLLRELHIPLNQEIAQNILTSIIVETNSFRLPSLNAQTFEICAQLLKTGVDFTRLTETVYWVTSRPAAMLAGTCLKRCRFSEQGDLAWSTLTKQDFRNAAAVDADADSVIEKIRSIVGVRLAILFRPKGSGYWRVSFRSKDGINAVAIAEKFGGGGHTGAAGCTLPKTNETIQSVLQEARSALDAYDTSVRFAQVLRSDSKGKPPYQPPALTFCETLPCTIAQPSTQWNEVAVLTR